MGQIYIQDVLMPDDEEVIPANRIKLHKLLKAPDLRVELHLAILLGRYLPRIRLFSDGDNREIAFLSCDESTLFGTTSITLAAVADAQSHGFDEVFRLLRIATVGQCELLVFPEDPKIAFVLKHNGYFVAQENVPIDFVEGFIFPR